MKRADHRIENDTTGFGRLRPSAVFSFFVFRAMGGMTKIAGGSFPPHPGRI